MRRWAIRSGLAVVLALVAALLSAPEAKAQNRFYLVNNTGETILRAYVSPSRSNRWGPDMLGQSVLPPGGQIWLVPYTSDCILDIKVQYQTGREEVQWQINTCTLSRIVWNGAGGGYAPPPVARGGNPSFQFVNNTGQEIRELYVSLTSDRNWGPDRLGSSTLPPGTSFPVSLPTGPVCTADIRVVFANGASTERRGVETCSRNVMYFR
ncbi:Tat pathway signal protein [Roseomonas sp. NAR14]|uniref:Tat pathway signal protein n=1 Tax=Roseomonas acroporae TaxID=2937791 RepID=A0A9X1Y8D5_9PROT|nr:Tat pathway signal protein [Roseomonas acroporae]MCK8785108.1 Tat pathway signal protein [Roseomonas acroporae]